MPICLKQSTLLPLVNLCDFCLTKTIACYFDLFGHFRDVERLYPPKSVRLSNNKVSFGFEPKKLIKKHLVLECQNV